MEIIPVIDLKDGRAVHAIKGQRSQYRAVKSELCSSSDPEDIIGRFMELGSFKKIYIADLNSIMGKGNNDKIIKRLTALYPNLFLWIDDGFRHTSPLSNPTHNHVHVIGSESVDENKLYLLKNLRNSFVLSLDYIAECRLGPDRLFTNEKYWPKNIIIMTLGRVGSNEGPDYQKLDYFLNRYPDKNVIAAGGIRNMKDLLEMKKMGIKMALIASALHSKSISAEEISQL